MRTSKECLPCFDRQARDACTLAQLGLVERERVLAAVQVQCDTFSHDRSPVEMAAEIHDLVRSALDQQDPYAEIKRESNTACRACLPLLQEHLAWSPDRFTTATKMAIAGNMIDAGAYSARHVSRRDVIDALAAVLSYPLTGSTSADFRRAVTDARRILFIGDNAGECFFDRLLLQQLPLDTVTYAVRGKPVLNDATMADAHAAGIHELCRVIDTGDSAPGIRLARCSEEFRHAFEQADVVIAKGQGNYESLSHLSGRTFIFPLRVKCPVIAADIGHPVGSSVLRIVEPEQHAEHMQRSRAQGRTEEACST